MLVCVSGCILELIIFKTNTYTSNYDVCVHTMYSGIDWVYTYVETLYAYDYKVVYFWFLNVICGESVDFVFFFLFGALLQTTGLQLF